MVTSSSESPRGVWGAARLSIALAASWAFLPAALPVSADPPDDSSSPRVVRALRVDQPIRIDGHLSEPAWQRSGGGRRLLPRPADSRHARAAPHGGIRPLRCGGHLCRLSLLGAGHDPAPGDPDPPRHPDLDRRRRRGRPGHLPRPPQCLRLRHQHPRDPDGPAPQQRELLQLCLGRLLGSGGPETPGSLDRRVRHPPGGTAVR